MSPIISAFEFATEAHEGQVRKASIVSDVPYTSHLMEVAGMVQASGGDDETVSAVLLHDVLEDTNATMGVIEVVFGTRVAFLVQECTEKGTEGSNGSSAG